MDSMSGGFVGNIGVSLLLHMLYTKPPAAGSCLIICGPISVHHAAKAAEHDWTAMERRTNREKKVDIVADVVAPGPLQSESVLPGTRAVETRCPMREDRRGR